jgi:hypothetical protein
MVTHEAPATMSKHYHDFWKKIAPIALLVSGFKDHLMRRTAQNAFTVSEFWQAWPRG